MILFVVQAEHKLGNLIPGEALIYERSNGVVYARYRDRPEIRRWIIGTDPGTSWKQGDMINYTEWQKLCELCETHPTLKKQMEKLVNTYYIIKDSK
jgi:hypothetical protein